MTGLLLLEKKGPRIGKTKRGKGTKVMVIVDKNGIPISAGIESASPHESKLSEGPIIRKKVKSKIKDLVGDLAYDSDPLDEYLKKKYKVNLIAPHKSNRKKKKTQDGRKLRKYRGRWKIERTFSWLQNFRRFATRYERNDQNFYGILILACIMVVIRSF
ncbi:IS5 family transposase [Leptospira mayottensis]|uniref:IS5 family transposase n=2 Tax=Leptospira mayottensis TaxID=1137606 RepID=A0ABM6Y7C3_9LEPT|nr:IS5 family transposase [Leptospira mayottensis]AXR63752.1 IS5 family transposase [Leptospira mayottensis]AZQ03586.1 hypothetical protein LEP1GSC190_17725 [Leptospira mayottensis 200901116]